MSYTKPFTIIFTWNNYDEQAYNLQQRIITITGQCAVISSHDRPTRKRKDWYYIGEEAYYTAQWNFALNLFKEHKHYNTLVQIQADSSCSDWKFLYSQIEASYKRFKWGVYSPYVDWSGHYPPVEFTEHPEGYRSVKRTDCTVWAINELLLLQGVDKFDESLNKYGWGIDYYYNQMALKSNREIILDYNISIDHPKGSNYDHEEATKQAKLMTDELFNLETKISLCTSISNRIEDFQYTLPHNLKFIESYGKQVEWIVADYGSNNINEVRELIESAKKPANLNMIYHRHNEKWNIGRAKKLAHDLASGDILLNLDADNFIGIRFLELLDQVYQENPLSIVYYKWEPTFLEYRNNIGLDLGFMGKIALSKAIYNVIGGYPIDLQGYGGDDSDLINRALLLPINEVLLNDHMRHWTKTIPTVDEHVLEANSDDGRINHEAINIKISERLKLPMCTQYKSQYIQNQELNLNDECIYELYNIIYKDPTDINFKIHFWAQESGNDLKTLLLSEMYSIENMYQIENMDSFNDWLTIIHNNVYNKLNKECISKEQLIESYSPLFSDYKQTNNDLIIVTSLSSRKNHLISQPICLHNWKKSGLKIYSVNTSKEISYFKNIYPEVDEWIQNDDLSTMFEIPSQRISSLLNVATVTNKNIILINSDIEIHADSEIPTESISIGIRNNYNKFHKKSNIEPAGLDIFILSPEAVELIPPSDFAIGRPFWDYYIAYILDNSHLEINLISDIFYHKNHPINWNTAECKIGTQYMANNHNTEIYHDWLDWRLKKGYCRWIKHDK